MTTDYLITIALVVGMFSIPAMIAAYADDRFPRVSMAVFGLCLGTLIFVVLSNPEQYSFGTLPLAVVRVIADILH